MSFKCSRRNFVIIDSFYLDPQTEIRGRKRRRAHGVTDGDECENMYYVKSKESRVQRHIWKLYKVALINDELNKITWKTTHLESLKGVTDGDKLKKNLREIKRKTTTTYLKAIHWWMLNSKILREIKRLWELYNSKVEKVSTCQCFDEKSTLWLEEWKKSVALRI